MLPLPTAHSSKPVLLPKTSPPRNFVGLTLKEYFKIEHAPLPDIHEENHSDADAATPSFNHHARPKRTRHKTELEDFTQPTKQNSHPKPSHRTVTLSLEELPPVEKSEVRLPAIHEQRTKQSPTGQGGQGTRKTEESGSVPLAMFLRQGKASLGKKAVGNMRGGLRSRVTSTSFYHMNARTRTEQEEPALEKSFVITRYAARGFGVGGKEDLRRYEQSFKLARH